MKKRTDQILGATIVEAHAGALISEITVLMKSDEDRQNRELEQPFDDMGNWSHDVQPRTWSDDPGQLFERKEFWDALSRCLETLPPMLSCKDAARLFSDSMDRTLPLRQRLALAVHFLPCKFCDRYRKQLLLMRQALRRSGRHEDELPPGATLSTQARNRIKRLLSSRK